jgi:hypothetical protein
MEYNTWCQIKRRCLNSNDTAWPNYGGRGITICDKWAESFEAFFNDVGPRPSRKHSIDRLNNDGNYEPGNVRWATQREQMQNTRRNRYVTLNGETKTVMEWSRVTGVHFNTIRARLNRGLSPEEALSPVNREQTSATGRKRSVQHVSEVAPAEPVGVRLQQPAFSS